MTHGQEKPEGQGDWELREARRVEKLWERVDVSQESLGTWKQRWEMPEERQGGRALVSSSTGNNKLHKGEVGRKSTGKGSVKGKAREPGMAERPWKGR